MPIGCHPAHPKSDTEDVHAVSERMWKADQLVEVDTLAERWLSGVLDDPTWAYVFNDLDLYSVVGT